MKSPSKIARILEIETRATSSDHEQIEGPAHGAKQYAYELLFDRTASVKHIQSQVDMVSNKEDLPLRITAIQPRIIQTDSTIEAGYVIKVKELEDRAELENHDLGSFSDDS